MAPVTRSSAIARRTAVTLAHRRRAQLIAMLAASVLGAGSDHRDATEGHGDHGGYGRSVDGDGR